MLADQMKVKNRFELAGDIPGFEKSYNIAPGQQILAVIHDGERRRAGYLRWGLVPFWAQDEKIGYKMINARSETIHQKPSFKHLLGRKHCLVVADSFYEWQKTATAKQAKRISVEKANLFAFAGLWEKWEHEGQKLFTCTILTQASNAFMKPIHHRMPVILPKEQENHWLQLQSSPFGVKQYVEELVPEQLTAYNVSDYVNYAKHNDKTCIEPMNTEMRGQD